MGIPCKHPKVKLIIGLIGPVKLFIPVIKKLIKKFGELDFESKIIDFNFTDYYEPEMGTGLKRKFLSFKREICVRDLAKIKLYSNKLENIFAGKNKKRRINIDPGYLTLSKLVLATTKDHQHRLYLDKGIFAEVTLRFRGKTFTAWDWTYPDYATGEYIAIFNHIRNNLSRKEF
ncbi:MAG: DUF4416 family protein [Candidatus Omnitrophota bacterium]